MTGFGRASASSDLLSISCEIRSLNWRGLDVKIHLPRELSWLEPELLSACKPQFSRGKLDVFIKLGSEALSSKTFGLNPIRAQQLLKSAQQIDPSVRLADLLHVPDLLEIKEEAVEQDAVSGLAKTALQGALDELLGMRQAEGKALAKALSDSISNCANMLRELEPIATQAPQLRFAELSKRVQLLLGDLAIDERRQAAELAILIDKMDVSEEIQRFRQHLSYFLEIMCKPEPCGRQLDFLCQELLREANTFANKCTDGRATPGLVSLKAEIERVREQVQNIE